MKFTLLCLGVQLMVDETTKNCSDRLDMILECRGIYQDVVDIDNYPAVKHVSLNTSLMKDWKTDGLLASPKGITRYS